MRRLTALGCATLAAWALNLARANAGNVTLADGETYTVAADEGAFTSRLDVPSGTATLDCTAATLTDGAFTFSGSGTGLRTGAGARLNVTGATSLVFAGEGTATAGLFFSVNRPLLDADIAFAEATGKVHVRGKVTLERLRDNYVIDPAADVAYWGTNMFTGATWRLTDTSAALISTAAVAPETTIALEGASTLSLKPCRHNPNDPWLWSGISGVFSNDFEIASGSTLCALAYRDLELTGAIRGTGRLAQTDNTYMNSALTLSGDLSQFGGTLLVGGTGRIVVPAASIGNGSEVVVLGHADLDDGGSLQLVPPRAEGATVATGVVHTVRGCRARTSLYAGANTELRVNSFSGTGGVKTENLTDAHVTFEDIAPQSCLVLRYTANVTLTQVAVEGFTVRVVGISSQRSCLELAPGAGALPVLDVEAGADVTLVGDGEVTRVTGAGTVRVAGNVRLVNVDPGVTVRLGAEATVRANMGDSAAAALESVLGERPALWLDASKTNTVQQYLNCVYTNGIVIRRWNDCRAEQTAVYGLNARGDGYARVYPFVNEKALNGMNVISMGALGGTVPREHGHVNVSTGKPIESDAASQPETRRLPLNKAIPFRTIIAVINTERGGGAALMGGRTAADERDIHAGETYDTAALDCALWRGGSTAQDWTDPATPIFTTARPTWLDGRAVDPTTTGYNGRWQIVACASTNEVAEQVRALGWATAHGNSGGIDYAEVLVYTNLLTDAERRAVEVYLSRKWNVPLTATALNGVGTVIVDDALVAAGSFRGTVEVKAGAWLNLAATPPPPTAEEVVTTNMLVGWFDPDAADDLMLGTKRDGVESNYVYALFDHRRATVKGTSYLHGTYNAYSGLGTGDRRPRAVRRAQGDSPARTWLTFYEDAETFDGGGNNLRLKTNTEIITDSTMGGFYENTTLPVRTAFIVSDSRYGGGNPILDEIRGGGKIKRRNVANAASPIWATGTDALVTNGLTRLNGLAVNGKDQGFTGEAEIFSFSMTNRLNVGFFGSYGNYNSEGSYEMLGEILLYNREITGDERDRIETYLAAKWLGRLGADLCDWRGATVTGAGTVTAARSAYLPQFDASFTGALALTDAAPTFHVDAAGTVTDAWLLPEGATLALPSAGTATVTFAAKPATCTLATAGAITGFDAAQWQVVVVPEARARLMCADGALRCEIIPNATLLILR